MRRGGSLTAMSEHRLTHHATFGGCAAKLRLGDLVSVLGAMDRSASDAILVDQEFADDAAVVRVADGKALVMTTDFIGPLVDDAETFGAIAATNAMSDVWAMGGEPRFALGIVIFPPDELPLEVLHAIQRGAARACAAAGVAIVGGHSVCGELKYGLAVTGEVDPDAVLSNRGARPGQALVLTKALGTGVIGSAIKSGVADDRDIAAAVASMTTLNRGALAVGRAHGVTACTDVTGFGLLGHLRNILRGSDLAATLELGALPLLPGARDHARAGRVPGGSRANRAFVAPQVVWTDGTPLAAQAGDGEAELLASLACDAQTSGGLLLCLPADRADAAVAALRDGGLPAARVGALHEPGVDMPAGRRRLAPP
jgi:selenide,water dikinase